MANMSSGLYALPFREALFDATPVAMNLTSASNVVGLMLDTFATNEEYDTIAAYDANITDYEVLEAAVGYDRMGSGTGKTVGGTPTFAVGVATQLKYHWSAAVAWAASTITANGMVVGTVTTFVPFCGVGFGANYTSTTGTFTVTQNALGIFTIDLS